MPSKLPALLIAAALLLTVAACGDDSASSTSAQALDRQLCMASDVGPDFREEAAGSFTPGNLADLASNSSARRKELEAAGLKDGRFAYWKHFVGDPPFPPPLEIVCQAMEFGSSEQAAAYVSGLHATPEDLATTAISWIPDENRTVNQVSLPPRSSGRGFQISAGGNSDHVDLFAVIVASGVYVRTVYAGKQGGTAQLTDATSVQDRMSARIEGPGATSASP
jgi:hypothetical protein